MTLDTYKVDTLVEFPSCSCVDCFLARTCAHVRSSLGLRSLGSFGSRVSTHWRDVTSIVLIVGCTDGGNPSRTFQTLLVRDHEPWKFSCTACGQSEPNCRKQWLKVAGSCDAWYRYNEPQTTQVCKATSWWTSCPATKWKFAMLEHPRDRGSEVSRTHGWKRQRLQWITEPGSHGYQPDSSRQS